MNTIRIVMNTCKPFIFIPILNIRKAVIGNWPLPRPFLTIEQMTDQEPYVQLPFMGCCHFKRTGCHWQIHPHVLILSLHNSTGRPLVKPSNSALMVGVVLHVLSGFLIFVLIGWGITPDIKAWHVRSDAETHDQKILGVKSIGIMVSRNFETSEQSQHPSGFQANGRVKLFITGNCT